MSLIILSPRVDKFSVIHQSSDTLISMHMGDSVVPLFCVASKHCSSYQYNWDNLHGNVGQLSPVLYANKVGIYRCTITHGLEGLSASKCYSKSISVNEGI